MAKLIVAIIVSIITIIIVFAVGIMAAISFILNGYVLSVLWGWFIVPTFGAPELGIVPAIGLVLVVGILTHGTRGIGDIASYLKKNGEDENKDEDLKACGKKLLEYCAVIILAPLIALLLGWIAHLFM